MTTQAAEAIAELRRELARAVLETEHEIYRSVVENITDAIPWSTRAKQLLSMTGRNTTFCRHCKRPLIWVRTRRGKDVPFNPDCTPHWTTCPSRDPTETA